MAFQALIRRAKQRSQKTRKIQGSFCQIYSERRLELACSQCLTCLEQRGFPGRGECWELGFTQIMDLFGSMMILVKPAARVWSRSIQELRWRSMAGHRKKPLDLSPKVQGQKVDWNQLPKFFLIISSFYPRPLEHRIIDNCSFETDFRLFVFRY